MKLDHEQMLDLLRLISNTRSEEIDCDAFLSRVALYLELFADHAAALSDFEEVRHHLQMCPECREEFEALVRGDLN